MHPITCKYCGGYEGNVMQGNGPHAYQIICSACNRHNKWASFIDVEEYSVPEMIKMLSAEETLSIMAGKNGDFKSFMAHSAKHDKILEKLNERV